MADERSSLYDDVGALERYLNLPSGTLRQIPIYARKPAVDAIVRVREMESKSLFRPGLYYIVLADLVGNTAFNAKWGDAEGDVRTEWFHTSVVTAIGQIDMENYVTFNKTIGDASLLVFSSFADVYSWSLELDRCLAAMADEYPESLEIRGVPYAADELDERVSDFELRARRLVHLGEVAYADVSDPLSLAISQTFKVEKAFQRMELGCTGPVANAIQGKLGDLGVGLIENVEITLPGASDPQMSYYVVPKVADGAE